MGPLLGTLEGTVFNCCKIQAMERPESTKEKIRLVFTCRVMSKEWGVPLIRVAHVG
jgi:hypothetical protein